MIKIGLVKNKIEAMARHFVKNELPIFIVKIYDFTHASFRTAGPVPDVPVPLTICTACEAERKYDTITISFFALGQPSVCATSPCGNAKIVQSKN